MNDEQERILLERLDQLDRRIGVIGYLAMAATSFCGAGVAFYFVRTDLGFDDFWAAVAGLVVWCAVGGALAKDFDKR